MPEESPVDFGTMFRQARERRGMSLQQIAGVTKISARVLDALERNDVSKLPGGIFSRAFVRSYAHEVGLDPDMAIERLASEFPDESGREQLPSAREAEEIEAFASGRRLATTVLQLVVLAVLVVLGVVGVVEWRACRGRAVSTPAASAPTASTPVSSAPVPAPPVSAPLAPTPAPSAAMPVNPLPVAERPPRADTTAAPIQLGIAAQDECWLWVKVDQDVVFGRILRAGERLFYEAYASVTLKAGNAGSLSLTINGKPARPLGMPGQVVTATITLATLASFL